MVNFVSHESNSSVGCKLLTNLLRNSKKFSVERLQSDYAKDVRVVVLRVVASANVLTCEF